MGYGEDLGSPESGGGASAGEPWHHWAQGGAVGFLGTQELEWRVSGLPREKGRGVGASPVEGVIRRIWLRV